MDPWLVFCSGLLLGFSAGVAIVFVGFIKALPDLMIRAVEAFDRQLNGHES